MNHNEPIPANVNNIENVFTQISNVGLALKSLDNHLTAQTYSAKDVQMYAQSIQGHIYAIMATVRNSIQKRKLLTGLHANTKREIERIKQDFAAYSKSHYDVQKDKTYQDVREVLRDAIHQGTLFKVIDKKIHKWEEQVQHELATASSRMQKLKAYAVNEKVSNAYIAEYFTGAVRNHLVRCLAYLKLITQKITGEEKLSEQVLLDLRTFKHYCVQVRIADPRLQTDLKSVSNLIAQTQ